MTFRNYTPFSPMTFESKGLDGKSFQVVILRGTFEIIPDSPLKPFPDQQPIVTVDQYYDEPNTSSVRFESDLAPYKPRADVVINATAHAPGKQALPQWRVSVQVGKLRKSLIVTGPRFWEHHIVGGWKLTEPEPCVEVPIKYEHAFGGQWRHEDESGVFEENPVGVGFVNKKYLDKSEPVLAPQIMSPEEPVKKLGEIHAPQGFSAITKSWTPRRKLAGAYDEIWLQERHPKYPKDFDYNYFNCAHPDLIYDGYLKGNEIVVLKHLHPEHDILRFALPNYQLGLLLRYQNGAMAMAKVAMDTLYLDVPENRAYLVWRGQFDASAPLRVIEARMTVPTPKQERRTRG